MTLERAVFASVAFVGAALAAVAFALAPRAAVSVAGGAALAVANLWAMRGTVRVLAGAAAGGQAPRGYAVLLSMKLLALFGFVWLLLTRGLVSAGPFAIGYGALPIGVAIGALVCDKARS
ncbi:MAG TPA: hypothetical protein VGH28_23695 [Polyangiaceae bacterium]|jgi:hypothetical protein